MGDGLRFRLSLWLFAIVVGVKLSVSGFLALEIIAKLDLLYVKTAKGFFGSGYPLVRSTLQVDVKGTQFFALVR